MGGSGGERDGIQKEGDGVEHAGLAREDHTCRGGYDRSHTTTIVITYHLPTVQHVIHACGHTAVEGAKKKPCDDESDEKSRTSIIFLFAVLGPINSQKPNSVHGQSSITAHA